MAPAGGQNISRKVLWAVWISSIGQKLRYFTDENGSNGGPHENEFWNSEINVTKKSVVISLISMFPSELWSLNCQKGLFCNFVLTSARNIGLLKQFTYMHLKGLIMYFQKMVLFVMLWHTVLEISGFEVEESFKISAWSASFLIF